MVVEGVCLLVVLIGRLGRHGAGLIGMLNEVPAAVEHEFGPPAVQCKSQAPPDLPFCLFLTAWFLGLHFEIQYHSL